MHPARAGQGAAERLLPEAQAVLAAAGPARQVATGIAAGADGILRVRLGERASVVDRLIEVHRPAPPDIPVVKEPSARPERPRLKRYGEK